MRTHYPNAVTILVRERIRPKARFGSYMGRLQDMEGQILPGSPGASRKREE